MPKRLGKRERWLRKMREKSNPPEVRMFRRAMYDPHFARSVRAWRAFGMGVEWCEAAEQNLDRPDL